jgi:aryl-alcohol dehydrogenase-like predicted oxidoreductase
MSRLALGTAQFGLSYGISNRAGQVDSKSVTAILARAASAGVDTLDTAISYGESESVLGRAGVRGWKVVTKLPGLPADVRDVANWVESQTLGSLERLGVARLDALMLHRPADLLGENGVRYQASLERLKAQGVARSVGVSIYDPTELDALWGRFRPDIVQAPLNVFDRRLIASGWLARLVSHGVRVHVRSVFLQGVLVMAADARPGYFFAWRDLFDRWTAWCAQQDVAPQRAALAFIDAQRGIERYVIGVDSLEQLDELVAPMRAVPTPPADLASDDRELIEPSRWKLQ